MRHMQSPQSPSLFVWLTQSLGNSPSPKIWPAVGKQGCFFVLFVGVFLSLQVPKWCLWKRFKNVFSTHHTSNNQLCTPFWLKLQGKEAFSKALLAFPTSHSNMPWNCSAQELIQEGMRSSLLLQTEPSAFAENLAFSLRKLIWGRGCWIEKFHCLHLLGKCRSSLDRKQQSPFSLRAGSEIQEIEPPSSTAVSVNVLSVPSLSSVKISRKLLCPMACTRSPSSQISN